MRGGRRHLLASVVPGAVEILPGRQRGPTVVHRHDRAFGPVKAVEPADDPATTPVQPFPALLHAPTPGTGGSRRQLVAGEVLWHALAASRHSWRRSITLDGELMSFYCPPARVALEISEAVGGAAGVYDVSGSGPGLRRVPIPIVDVEQRCATIVSWLDTLCASRIQSEAQSRSAGWLRRKKGPETQLPTNGARAS